MLGRTRWLSLTLVVALATAGFGLAAGADSASEGEFLSLINASRASAGLAPLTIDSGLRSHARYHTGRMIDGYCAPENICHSSSSELGAAAGSGWEAVAENVGRGGTPQSLHNAFMDSSGHRANILGNYNYVGIGTDSADGYLYVTVVFMRKGGGSEPAPTTTAPSTNTTSAATPTTAGPTTTTLPPTTTTTMDVGPDRAVTPGVSCVEATRFSQICHS